MIINNKINAVPFIRTFMIKMLIKIILNDGVLYIRYIDLSWFSIHQTKEEQTLRLLYRVAQRIYFAAVSAPVIRETSLQWFKEHGAQSKRFLIGTRH